MINLRSIEDWKVLEAGEMVQLKRKGRRVVTFHVNASEKTRLMFAKPRSKARFLALVEGLTAVRFTADGPIDIAAEAEIWYQTTDNEKTAMAPVGENFVRTMASRMADPVEAMMRGMSMRIGKQMAEHQHAMNQAIAENAAQYEERIAELEDQLEGEDEEELYDDEHESESDPSDEETEPEPRKRAAPRPRARKAKAARPKKPQRRARANAQS